MAISKAQREAVGRYETKVYDKILIRIRKADDSSGLSREIIQQAADAEGMSLNAYILQAISEKINKK